MEKLKNKKMATLGLYMIFIGGIISITGGFIYNKYKDKSSAEKHTEILKNQDEIKNKGDSNTKSIIQELKSSGENIKVNSAKNSPIVGKVENQTINYFDNKKEKKDNMENKKNDTPNVVNVTSYNQSGGITANQVNIGSQPRVLDTKLQSQLLQLLSGKKAQTISVVSVMGDGEAFSFATQIKNFLTKEGFTVDGVSQAVYTEPVMGQNFNPEKLEIVIGTRH